MQPVLKSLTCKTTQIALRAVPTMIGVESKSMASSGIGNAIDENPYIGSLVRELRIPYDDR